MSKKFNPDCAFHVTLGTKFFRLTDMADISKPLNTNWAKITTHYLGVYDLTTGHINFTKEEVNTNENQTIHLTGQA